MSPEALDRLGQDVAEVNAAVAAREADRAEGLQRQRDGEMALLNQQIQNFFHSGDPAKLKLATAMVAADQALVDTELAHAEAERHLVNVKRVWGEAVNERAVAENRIKEVDSTAGHAWLQGRLRGDHTEMPICSIGPNLGPYDAALLEARGLAKDAETSLKRASHAITGALQKKHESRQEFLQFLQLIIAPAVWMAMNGDGLLATHRRLAAQFASEYSTYRLADFEEYRKENYL